MLLSNPRPQAVNSHGFDYYKASFDELFNSVCYSNALTDVRADAWRLLGGARVTAGNFVLKWPELRENEVHFWVVSLAQFPANSCWYLLSPDEHNRAERFCFESSTNHPVQTRRGQCPRLRQRDLHL